MRNTLIITASIILFVCTISIVKYLSNIATNQKEDIIYQEDFGASSVIKIESLPIPLSLTFAGDVVPIEYIDVKEKLDRELAINCFGHSNTYLLIKRANRYLPYISKILSENDLPDDLKFIPVIESGLTNAVSPSKAVGFWQFLEGTAKEFGLEVNKEIDERYNWKKSTQAACDYFKWLNKKYNSWPLSAAAYNCGRTALNRFIDIQKVDNYYSLLLSEETERYLFRVLALKLILSEPERYGYFIEYNEMYQYIDTYEVKIDKTIPDLALWAKKKGLTYRELKYFNPWLRANTLTVTKNKKYTIELPHDNYRKTH
ncbi:MAG TPA: transglycosylase SLT domain-containing protein [Salinivirgaceae bacterium]|nr:transglycosylase SLT domain-containing protein [Salinivirgaceae bacterium]HQA75635.1 transglycosylase SLT domain-containing protein [Salinivirgaceae bacterium]